MNQAFGELHHKEIVEWHLMAITTEEEHETELVNISAVTVPSIRFLLRLEGCKRSL